MNHHDQKHCWNLGYQNGKAEGRIMAFLAFCMGVATTTILFLILLTINAQ